MSSSHVTSVPRTTKIPRPENPFILFRRDALNSGWVQKTSIDPHTGQLKNRSQAELSKEVGALWNKVPDELKRRYEVMAQKKKSEHKQMYPDYQFRPQRRPKKSEKEKTRSTRLSTTRMSASSSSDTYPNASTASPPSFHPPPPAPDQLVPSASYASHFESGIYAPAELHRSYHHESVPTSGTAYQQQSFQLAHGSSQVPVPSYNTHPPIGQFYPLHPFDGHIDPDLLNTEFWS
ncbi:hypothetical protein V5O48_001965 [Marasmius crinis-equi]|uniref:HMG box domain-containing protein n=1 Tax=Marasmius crinis-equi TaxID=585013 RepID=A0ABR3FWX1_9AGAR